MIILGISGLFHDAAAALVVDGKIIAAAQEERFTRIKHDAALPAQSARHCLESAGLTIRDVDRVVFYEDSTLKFDRLVTHALHTFPQGARFFARSMHHWLSDRLWTSTALRRELGCTTSQIAYCDHHLAHAASTFLTSPFEEAAVLTVDGVGEWATTSIYGASSGKQGSEMHKLCEAVFPNSIGLLYSAVTAYLGFTVNEGEYKVMGLASYGTPRFQDEFAKLCVFERLSAPELKLDMRYFCFDRDPIRSFTHALVELLGPAREPGALLDPWTGEGQRYADIAASLQKLTEDYLVACAQKARHLTGAQALCMAGGVALNCVANTEIAKRSGFDHVYVHPAAGDAGGALGAALWMEHVVNKSPRESSVFCAELGAGYADSDVSRFLHECGVSHHRLSAQDEMADEVARRLSEGEVGAICRDRFEWGPRALGSRSIIADPRRAEMSDRVNGSIKFREGFRPFAPAVLEEDVPVYFEEVAAARPLLPYMLATLRVRETARVSLGAVTHVDGTARVQSLARDAGGLRDIVEAFKRRTGVGAVLNTSLNLKDEPPCGSPGEALALFLRADVDFLVIGACLVTRSSVPDALKPHQRRDAA